MNCKNVGVCIVALFYFYYKEVAGVNLGMQDDHEELNIHRSLKNYGKNENNPTLKAMKVQNITNEIPLNQIKDSKNVSTVNTVKALHPRKVIKIKETGTDNDDHDETFSDFYIVDDKSHKHLDHGFNLDHKADTFYEDDDKEAKTTNRMNFKNKQEQRYRRTGKVVFYEEEDNENNDADLPKLNVYVKKDKPLNIEDSFNYGKLRNSTTNANKRQKTIENILKFEKSGELEAVDNTNYLFTADALPTLRNGDLDNIANKNNNNEHSEHEEAKGIHVFAAIKKYKPSLTELPESKVDDETCDIIIKNDNIHEFIERNEYPFINNRPLFTKVEYSPENLQQPHQTPAVQIQGFQNSKKGNNRPYNPYKINYGNGNLRFVPPQAGYPQGYYTNIDKKYVKPYFYPKAANSHYVDYINPKVYPDGNHLNPCNPDYSHLTPLFRYPIKNQFQDLWDDQRKKYNVLNYEKSPYYTWSGRNYQEIPVGYTSYNPSNQYSYQEVMQPQNYLDKIWRSWRRTQIILNDPKKKVNLLRNYEHPYLKTLKNMD